MNVQNYCSRATICNELQTNFMAKCRHHHPWYLFCLQGWKAFLLNVVLTMFKGEYVVTLFNWTIQIFLKLTHISAFQIYNYFISFLKKDLQGAPHFQEGCIAAVSSMSAYLPCVCRAFLFSWESWLTCPVLRWTNHFRQSLTAESFEPLQLLWFWYLSLTRKIIEMQEKSSS